MLVLTSPDGPIRRNTDAIINDALNTIVEDDIQAYSWELSNCQPCSAACPDPNSGTAEVSGTTTCQVVCMRSDGVPAPDNSFCDPGNQPGTGTTCSKLCPVNCLYDTSTSNCGPCDPECGTGREKICRYPILQEAQNGGQPCDPAAGQFSVSCPDTMCPAVCGNGVQETGESCDRNDFIEDKNRCSDWRYDGGTLGCASDCTLDFSACWTKKCGSWTNVGCAEERPETGGYCPSGTMTQQRTCWGENDAGDKIKADWIEDRCNSDPPHNANCVIQCGSINEDKAQWCSKDYDVGLTAEHDETVSYYDVCPEDLRCAAECLADKGLVADDSGFSCICDPDEDKPYWDAAEGECMPGFCGNGIIDDDEICDNGVVSSWGDEEPYGPGRLYRGVYQSRQICKEDCTVIGYKYWVYSARGARWKTKYWTASVFSVSRGRSHPDGGLRVTCKNNKTIYRDSSSCEKGYVIFKKVSKSTAEFSCTSYKGYRNDSTFGFTCQ